jgi:type III pantothenate kinase
MNALPRKPGKNALPVLTVMVGNTRTTAAHWSPAGKAIDRGDWATSCGGHAMARRILAAMGEGSATIVLAGVVPSVVDALERCLSSRLQPPSYLFRFRGNLSCPLRIRPRPAYRVGDDRLTAVLGALAIDPRVPWVVLDAGTALTVNSVRPALGTRHAGVFEGGLIVPGEQLALSALSAGTAQLPALKPLAPRTRVPVRGCSTEDAIRFGVRRAQMAAACALARVQARLLGRGTRIVLTGGGAAALWPAIRSELKPYRPVWVPDLVHRGLVACAPQVQSPDASSSPELRVR